MMTRTREGGVRRGNAGSDLAKSSVARCARRVETRGKPADAPTARSRGLLGVGDARAETARAYRWFRFKTSAAGSPLPSVGDPAEARGGKKSAAGRARNGVVAPTPDTGSRARPAEILDGIRAAIVGGRARGRRGGPAAREPEPFVRAAKRHAGPFRRRGRVEASGMRRRRTSAGSRLERCRIQARGRDAVLARIARFSSAGRVRAPWRARLCDRASRALSPSNRGRSARDLQTADRPSIDRAIPFRVPIILRSNRR